MFYLIKTKYGSCCIFQSNNSSNSNKLTKPLNFILKYIFIIIYFEIKLNNQLTVMLLRHQITF